MQKAVYEEVSVYFCVDRPIGEAWGKKYPLPDYLQAIYLGNSVFLKSFFVLKFIGCFIKSKYSF